MTWQSSPNILLVFILLVTVPHGHADLEHQTDVIGHTTRDGITKDMYSSLMERLERQETFIGQLDQELKELKMEVQQCHQMSESATIPKQLKDVPHFSPNRQDGDSEEAKHQTIPALDFNKTHMVNRQKRVGNNVNGTGIAFSTSMQNDANVHEHETLIFDHVILNEGNGYSNGDGVYTVPQSGVYVFTWSITSETTTGGKSDIHTNLMRNGQDVGGIDSDADEHNWGSATGVVVMHVEAGDHVYVRVTSNGKIISITESKSTFSGWFLF